METRKASSRLSATSNMFRRETEHGCRNLIHRATDRLFTCGPLVVRDMCADEKGAHPAFAAVLGLNMGGFTRARPHRDPWGGSRPMSRGRW